METKKTSMKGLLDKITGLESKREGIKSVGSYLYNGFKIQISEHGLSGAERVARLYARRKEQGLCVECGDAIGDTNPRTGKKYQKCFSCRNYDNQKRKNKNV